MKLIIFFLILRSITLLVVIQRSDSLLSLAAPGALPGACVYVAQRSFSGLAEFGTFYTFLLSIAVNSGRWIRG